MSAVRRAVCLPLALMLAAGAGAAMAGGRHGWRRDAEAPPQPYRAEPFPQDVLPLPSGFTMTAVKSVDRGGERPRSAIPDGSDKQARDTDEDRRPKIVRPRDIAEAITRCWSPPASSDRLEVTVRVQFNRSGGIVGKPFISYVKAGDGSAGRDALVESMNRALAACTPLRFTGSLGTAIAGYPFAIRFIADGRKPAASSKETH
jgi:hypothetical protein